MVNMFNCKRCTAPDTKCPYWEGTFCAYDLENASVAQLVERRPEEPSVTGSIPVGSTSRR